jgi:3-methyladenine DNA glycosylase/8-oxoguanine DNA glycosylase
VRFTTALPVDLHRSLRPLVASRADPTIVLTPTRVDRAWVTPEGPATITVRQLARDRFDATAVGPGADWAVAHAPDLVGAADDLADFVPDAHPAVSRAHRQRPGLRLIRSRRVVDVLVATVIAQRVTSGEAARSWTRLVRAVGAPAPGDLDLRLPPAPDELARTPTYAFVPFGIDQARASRIVAACRRLPHLQDAIDRAVEGDGIEARRRLLALPGLGPWTAGHLLRVAGGDPDAVEVGDYHVKHHVAWNLAGEPRADDERMLALLAPFAGHRGRVVRLLLSAGVRTPRYGPGRRVVPLDRW